MLCTVAIAKPATSQSELPNGVAAGDVTPTSVVLWARASAAGALLFEYSGSADFDPLEGARSIMVTDVAVPAKVEVNDLDPGQELFYRATDATGAASAGRLRTPALPGARAGLRFGVTGDWRGELAPYPAVANVPARNLDFFIALGDTIYADFPSPDVPVAQASTLEELRAKHNEVYREHLGLRSLADLRASTALFATIDDHEVTNDFAGGGAPASDPRFADLAGDFINETELFLNGVQAFQEWNPLRDEVYPSDLDQRIAGKRKLYRFRQFGDDAAMFLLDARSFRDAELPNVTNPLDAEQVENFLQQSFDSDRTMLGGPQIAELEDDLLRAHQAGVTWKFVLVPEPIQNISPAFASDRFEGYAAERSRLLRFIEDNLITNVVFIAADIHGTLINNLTYQLHASGPQIATGSFEMTTGPVAFDPPFGPFVAAGLPPAFRDIYDRLPDAERDGFLRLILDGQLGALGYDLVGLDGSGIDAELLEGAYLALHVYGWTEAEIDAASQRLLVTTYGIDPYSAGDLASHPADVTSLTPNIVSRFQVRPTSLCEPSDTTLCLHGGRYRIEATWRDHRGNRGAGRGVQISPQSGYFWFLEASNVELPIKVLDGRSLTGGPWLYFGALTDLEYTIAVTDTLTGLRASYENPLGSVNSVADVDGFSADGAVTTLPSLHDKGAIHRSDLLLHRRTGGVAGDGTPSPAMLCLDEYEVVLTWSGIDGQSRSATALPLTSSAGAFWFFDSDNPEVAVKLLDGSGINGARWIFIGSLTDLAWSVRFTEKGSGRSRVYSKSLGSPASLIDLEAFPVN